ncbi:unnamed protein product [Toxocara canis]|uniref:Recep_L_domain domain-containing protein n=1 Tax=Toxocara canis TaxID=6265 RepID=A0A183V9B9_TOXCA|nr:unnamed protein product [Toxocara canis]
MPCIIVRDFDACSNQNGVIHLSGSLEAFIRQCSVRQLVNGGARQDNMLDLVFTNDLTLVNEALIGENISISYHSNIHFELMVGPPLSLPHRYRDFRGSDWVRANAMLSGIDWDTYFFKCLDNEPMCARFIELLNVIVDGCIQLAKVKSTTPSLPKYLQRLAAK